MTELKDAVKRILENREHRTILSDGRQIFWNGPNTVYEYKIDGTKFRRTKKDIEFLYDTGEFPVKQKRFGKAKTESQSKEQPRETAKETAKEKLALLLDEPKSEPIKEPVKETATFDKDKYKMEVIEEYEKNKKIEDELKTLHNKLNEYEKREKEKEQKKAEKAKLKAKPVTVTSTPSTVADAPTKIPVTEPPPISFDYSKIFEGFSVW